MDVSKYPRKSRSWRRNIETAADEAQNGVKDSVKRPTEVSPKPGLSTADGIITLLPQRIKAIDVGLNTEHLKILLKKQKWLQAHSITLPDQDESLQKIVDATLIFGQKEAGTAVCISERGILLTCSHCVAETEEELDLRRLHCLLFASGQIVKAQCVAWDGKRDVALLRIVAAQKSHQSSFPALSLSSSPPKFREHLVCVGHPGSEDLESTSTGTKTNYDTICMSTGTFRGYAKGQDPQNNSEIGALKHDCWTYWGHSGAPLVNRNTGELIGLHSSWDDTTGMRRGIPLEAMRAFLEEYGFIEGDQGSNLKFG